MSGETEAVKQLDTGRCWYTDADTGNKTITLTNESRGLQIVNDGATDLVLTVNSMDFTVKSGEVFDEAFETMFTTIGIVTAVAWRLIVRI